MEIGEKVEVKFVGKCVKKELYKDGKVRVWVQDDVSQEMAVVIEPIKPV